MLEKLFSNINSDLELELSVTCALCALVDSPRSLMVYMMINSKEYSQLSNLSCDPLNYNSASSYADDVLVTDVLRKSSNLPLDIDLRSEAIKSFRLSEEQCAETNLFMNSSKPFCQEILDAKVHIEKILGPLTESLSQIESGFKFGPGSSSHVSAFGGVSSDKYDTDMYLTESLYPFYRSILGDRWWEHQRDPKIVQGNKFTTVPKTAKTDRGICMEPSLNCYMQLGIGSRIRNRLKTVGINLNSQDRNRMAARRAYKDGLATIDLERASDSLSTGTVRELLDSEWYSLLCLARSPTTLLDGEEIHLEKFSSMGNGFTFELESLIFYGVAISCVPFSERESVCVYGDDIIVPQAYAPRLVEVLKILGFNTNNEKSFLAGNFFESCGVDFFKGQPVRSFYLKRTKQTTKSRKGIDIPYALQIANALRLYSSRLTDYKYCEVRFRPIWIELSKLIPKQWRSCKVPATFGDVGLICDFAESDPRPAGNGLEGYLVRHITLKPLKIRKNSFGRLLYGLRSSNSPPVEVWAFPRGKVYVSTVIYSRGLESRRGLFGGLKTKRAFVFQWPSGYSWF